MTENQQTQPSEHEAPKQWQSPELTVIDVRKAENGPQIHVSDGVAHGTTVYS